MQTNDDDGSSSLLILGWLFGQRRRRVRRAAEAAGQWREGRNLPDVPAAINEPIDDDSVTGSDEDGG